MKTLVPRLKGIPSISREVEVKPLGPVQLQTSVKGWGPRLTVEPETTVTALTCCQAPPLTWI